MSKSCGTCVFAFMQDHGYSNWTVEGTTFTCVKGLHPDGSFDRFYNANPKFDFAEKCNGYQEGDPSSLDVDREDLKELDSKNTPAVAYLKSKAMLLNVNWITLVISN